MNLRRIYNPVQKDYVTFLETLQESNGQRTYCLLEIAPGGKVLPHYHVTYSETFVVQSGIMNVRVGNEELTLVPGERITVPPGILHAWYNLQPYTITVDVIIEPGHAGFERVLQAAYGLARDGKTRPDGTPNNLLHLAMLLDMSDMKLPGIQGKLGWVFRLLVRIAYWRGKDKDFEKYYFEFDTSKQAV